jgi:hypothetical protein
MFSDAFSRDHQLIRADPKHSLYLACALMVRGNVEISDVRRNIERIIAHKTCQYQFIKQYPLHTFSFSMSTLAISLISKQKKNSSVIDTTFSVY